MSHPGARVALEGNAEMNLCPVLENQVRVQADAIALWKRVGIGLVVFGAPNKREQGVRYSTRLMKTVGSAHPRNDPAAASED